MRTIHEAAQIIDCREQIQEDLIAWASTIPLHETCVDEVCQIVVDNFRQFEKDPETGQRFNA